MQIILLEKITNVGNLGDVVKVKNGFARNYLIPQGKAKRANPENLKLIEQQRSELEAAAGAKIAAAQALAEKIEGLALAITQKAGVDGRLFGSVTSADIVAVLKGHGVEIEKTMVRLPDGPLKHIGEFPLTISPHTDVVAHINVTVVGDTGQV
ncbi:MAG: 50S ribosomal protein L9 [Burkholderiales bacterium]|nr:50S ribosomal protein L9 [Burkholderiales bacterium]